jgi:uncharacterized membrane protein YidH (DUF202 family)
MTTNERPLREGGLQAERTGLAWTRTGLELFVVAALAARVAAGLDVGAPFVFVALLVAPVGLALGGCGRRLSVARADSSGVEPLMRTGVVTIVWLATATLCFGSLGLLLAST